MELNSRKEGDTVIVSVKGRIDAVTAPDFEKYLAEQADKSEKSLIVNMKELYYISSAGLRAVLGATKKLKEKRGDMILAEVQDTVREVFEIAGFNTFLKIFDTEKSALEQR